MSRAWELPTSLNIGGKDYDIRTDFRVILDLLSALSDPELTDSDPHTTSYLKNRVMIEIMFPEWETIPPECVREALEKAAEFIDMGIKETRKKPRIMDWEQDAPILIPAVNKVLGTEIRAMEYLHWYTFLGAYMGIRESLFSDVLHIRQKKAKKKKLEKWEQEFYRENKELIDLQRKEERSEEEKEELRELFGYKKPAHE